jgi:Zn-dependent protease with chaperone function
MTLDSTTAQRLAFERRAAAAEIAAAQDLKGYRLRVVAFALLGYAVLWFLLALLLALAGVGVVGAVSSTGVLVFLVKSKMGIALLVAIAILARSLWVRFDAPDGLRVDLAAFPQLREEIKRLRAATGAPAVHEVLLTPDFNAAMVQTPRLGVFGWQRNSVVLGLQLLLALTPEQCRAVIAHELAHLSGRHARLAAWIYRVRESWRRTMVAFDQAGSWATRWLAGFFHWYAPAFAAYSFALARRNEYEADALGANAATKAAAGEALVRTRVLSEVIGENYWKPIIERADHEADPERGAFSRLRRFLAEDLPGREVLEPILRRALTDDTGFADTHPALRDRLAALSAVAQVPAPISESAAQAWLGERLDAALDAFDVHWLQTNGEAWRQRFREAEQSRAALAALRDKPGESLTREERWQLAILGERFERDRDSMPAYLAFKERFPDDRQADFAIGRLLAERGDGACIGYLESSVGVPSLARPSAEIAARHLWHAGDKEAAECWRQRAEAAYDVECRAMRERQSVSENDEFLEPQLEAQVLQKIRDQLGRVPEIAQAWIARKSLAHFPEQPLYVLAFAAKGWRPNDSKLIQAIARLLDAPGQMFIVRKGGAADAVAKKVMKAGVAVLP